MTNIIKKIKNVNLFTKLVGIAMIAMIASCEACKDKDSVKFSLTANPAEIKDGANNFTVELKVAEGIAALEQYTLVADQVKLFSGDNYKDKGAAVPVTESLTFTFPGTTLKDATGGTAELKKEDPAKSIVVKIDTTKLSSAKSATFIVAVMKGTEKKGEVAVKWTTAK